MGVVGRRRGPRTEPQSLPTSYGNSNGKWEKAPKMVGRKPGQGHVSGAKWRKYFGKCEWWTVLRVSWKLRIEGIRWSGEGEAWLQCAQEKMGSVDWRKTHNLKVASYVLFGDLTEDYSPGDNLSALRNCCKEVKEESGYIRVFALKTKTCSRTSGDYCWSGEGPYRGRGVRGTNY